TYSSIANFFTNTLASVQFLGDVSAPSVFNGGATGQRKAKQQYYIAYAQDEWRLRPNLTLNYGLRYEYYTPLREDRDLQILFNIITGTLDNPKNAPFKSSKSNLGPRIALTWSPNPNGSGWFGGGHSVLRGGFGIYYGPGQTEDQIQPIESDRVASTFTSNPIFPGGPALAFPIDTSGIPAFFAANPNTRAYQPRAYSPDYKIPERVYQYSVSWQQQLPYQLTATAAYVGSQGRNLFLRSVANRILPGQATILDGTALPTGVGVVNRTNAGGQVIAVNQPIREFSIVSGTSTVQNPFAEVDYKTSGGHDHYKTPPLAPGRRFSQGVPLDPHYTYSKSFGNTAGSNEARTAANNARAISEFDYDNGFNNFDIRHSFNVSALYDLPYGKGKKHELSGVQNAILGDWEVGTIINARS